MPERLVESIGVAVEVVVEDLAEFDLASQIHINHYKQTVISIPPIKTLNIHSTLLPLPSLDLSPLFLP